MVIVSILFISDWSIGDGAALRSSYLPQHAECTGVLIPSRAFTAPLDPVETKKFLSVARGGFARNRTGACLAAG